MEAKDTVMSRDRIASSLHDEAMTCLGEVLQVELLLKDQAEISFKAGYDEATKQIWGAE